MKSHGWLFKAEMIRAMLRAVDPKTQTRRIVTASNSIIDGYSGRSNRGKELWAALNWKNSDNCIEGDSFIVEDLNGVINHRVSPIVQAGESFWARETWATTRTLSYVPPARLAAGFPCEFKVRGAGFWDALVDRGPWRSPLHLPRCAARISGPITAVRAEFLQTISEWDAMLEGTTPIEVSTQSIIFATVKARYRFRDGYRNLWNSINKDPGTRWDDNPPVWAYTFDPRT